LDTVLILRAAAGFTRGLGVDATPKKLLFAEISGVTGARCGAALDVELDESLRFLFMGSELEATPKKVLVVLVFLRMTGVVGASAAVASGNGRLLRFFLGLAAELAIVAALCVCACAVCISVCVCVCVSVCVRACT